MKKTLFFILKICLIVGAYAQNAHYASKVVTDKIQAIGDTVEIDSVTKIHANLYLNGDIADSIAATRGYVAANGGGSTINGTTDNGILTYINSSGEIQTESNLTYNGTLNVDNISAFTTNTNLTLSGNGTGNVIINDDATFSGNISSSGTINTESTYEATRPSNGALFRGSFDNGVTNNLVIQSVGSNIQYRATGAYNLAFQSNGANDRLTISQAGDVSIKENLQLDSYGSGTNTGTAAYSLAVDASGNVIEEVIANGTFNPTLTNATNISSSSVVNGQALYSRNGDIVTVTINVSLTPSSSSTLTRLRIDLPIASSLTGITDVIGNGVDHSTGRIASIDANTANNEAELFFTPTSTTNHGFRCTFQYIIK